MSNSFAYIDIILFAMLAAFIAFKLRSVLGRKTGNERRRMPPALGSSKSTSPVAPTVDPVDETGASGLPGLQELRAADPQFDPAAFLDGARAAFGLILDAFGRGDRASLEGLVERDVLESFAQAIDAREAVGETHGATLLSIDDAKIVGMRLDGSLARVTVQFTSRQTDPGATDQVHPPADEPVIDVWTFVRDTRSTDPNWRLAETRSPHV
ncbi:Predicted lipid-binding transport protein, Tim44 family [Arboricoccus pini]|uniref:Predicted lipid-binding transport protein, Tim44 family n=1 Tax=Arboricoccus pini TaxID=1963835 RepID=A0A212QSR6_9PROT|nr:Tim44/TimA family putative adaptor protein [Arboricoccus pini]SNB62637.1 Predicted lipid-binding transport protein, Tim44 family [Arboricoccus pini]